MSKQYPGGLITKTPVTPSGPYETSTASGIWTLDQQAYWQKLGQWPSAGNPPPDAQFNYVTMLLHGDGTNGAQNNTFLDSSTNNFTITRNGNTTQGSFSPYGSNWSNYFDGSSYLDIASATASGSGSFCIEAWIYSTNSSAQQMIVANDTSGGMFIGMNVNSANKLGIGRTFVAIDNEVSYTWANNTWYHVAVNRNGTNLQFFVNGTQVGSTVSNSINYSTAGRKIGAETSGGSPFYGYISNVRCVNASVYTSTFTPSTTPLTAITSTTLLTCQSNRFVDNSNNAFAITSTGTSVQRFNPFGASTAYSTSVIGGSGYFDGSGDYLTTTWSTIGANPFTCEAWVYMFNNSNRYYIVGPGTDTASHFDGFGFEIFNGYLSMWASSNGTGWNLVTSDTSQGRSANVLPVNAWTHVVMTRDSSGVFRSFINGNLQCTVSPGTAALADSGTTVLNIGRARYTGDFANFYGYMSNLRIVNGSVVTAYSTSSTTVGTQIFTPPTAPVTAITNTSLLANFTNGAIFDNAMMNDLETVGNAQISTSVKKYGTGSLAFDGTGDWLITPATPSNRINTTGNFTIEFWVYFNSVASNQRLIAWDNDSNNFVIAMYTSSSGVLAYYLSSNGTSWDIAQNASMGNISTNTWYHIALVRDGNVFTPYVNGVGGTTTTSSATLYSSTLPFVIGATGNGASNFNGYMDEFRITKGYARYTANFTPPTQAFQNFGPT